MISFIISEFDRISDFWNISERHPVYLRLKSIVEMLFTQVYGKTLDLIVDSFDMDCNLFKEKTVKILKGK